MSVSSRIPMVHLSTLPGPVSWIKKHHLACCCVLRCLSPNGQLNPRMDTPGSCTANLALKIGLPDWCVDFKPIISLPHKDSLRIYVFQIWRFTTTRHTVLSKLWDTKYRGDLQRVCWLLYAALMTRGHMLLFILDNAISLWSCRIIFFKWHSTWKQDQNDHDMCTFHTDDRTHIHALDLPLLCRKPHQVGWARWVPNSANWDPLAWYNIIECTWDKSFEEDK